MWENSQVFFGAMTRFGSIRISTDHVGFLQGTKYYWVNGEQNGETVSVIREKNLRYQNDQGLLNHGIIGSNAIVSSRQKMQNTENEESTA